MHVERNRAEQSKAKQNNIHSYKQEEKRERRQESSCDRKRQAYGRYFDIQTTEHAVLWERDGQLGTVFMCMCVYLYSFCHLDQIYCTQQSVTLNESVEFQYQ